MRLGVASLLSWHLACELTWLPARVLLASGHYSARAYHPPGPMNAAFASLGEEYVGAGGEYEYELGSVVNSTLNSTLNGTVADDPSGKGAFNNHLWTFLDYAGDAAFILDVAITFRTKLVTKARLECMRRPRVFSAAGLVAPRRCIVPVSCACVSGQETVRSVVSALAALDVVVASRRGVLPGKWVGGGCVGPGRHHQGVPPGLLLD